MAQDAQHEPGASDPGVRPSGAYDFERAVQSLPGLLWSAEPDGWVDFLNQRWLDYTGLSHDQACGWGWQAALHPDDLPALLVVWRGLLESGKAGEVEARLRRHDGAYRWFLFRAEPSHDAKGRAIKWYGQTIDIEERRTSGALLAAGKALLEMVARGVPLDAILSSVCRHIEAIVTGSFATVLLIEGEPGHFVFGAAPSLPAKLMSAVAECWIGPDGGPCARAAHFAQPAFSVDVTAENVPERLREVLRENELKACCCVPILSSEDRVLGTFALYWREPDSPALRDQNILAQFTAIASIAIERRQADESLRRSERYLAEAQRLSRTGSFSWNPDTGAIAWSEEVYSIYAIDPSTSITLARAKQQVHPEDVEHFTRVATESATNKTMISFTHRITVPGGKVKFLEIEAGPRLDLEGRFIEYIGAVRDVTDQRLAELAVLRMQEELARVTRVATLGELTASIAHELNQPLTGVVLNANTCLRWLAAPTPDLDEARNAALRIARDGKRATQVIERLRALFGKTQSVKAPVDLNDAIREVLTLSQSELHEKHVQLKTDWGPQLPRALADRVQLQQVVLNLIVNAVEAVRAVSGRQGEIIIATALDDDSQLRVSVRDNGCGVDPERSAHIFDAFYTSRAGGMGMGLAISRTIIENHEGRLWFESNDGPGSTFTFTIPRHT